MRLAPVKIHLQTPRIASIKEIVLGPQQRSQLALQTNEALETCLLHRDKRTWKYQELDVSDHLD